MERRWQSSLPNKFKVCKTNKKGAGIINNLQFGNYVFPHNPNSIKISNSLNNANHFIPYIGNKIEVMGPQAKIVHVSGEFFGATALDALNQYTTLEAIFKNKGKGMLFIPCKKPFYTVFSKLDMLAVGDGKIIAYSAEFIEDMSKSINEA